MAQQPKPVPDDFIRSFIVMPGRPGIYWVPTFGGSFLVARPIDDLSKSVIIHWPSVDFTVVPEAIITSTVSPSILNSLPDK